MRSNTLTNLRKVMLNGTIDDFYLKLTFNRSWPSVFNLTKTTSALSAPVSRFPSTHLRAWQTTRSCPSFNRQTRIQVLGRGVLAAIDKTSVSGILANTNKTITDLIFNSQYSELLTTPSLQKYRAFIVDWPKSDKLPSVKLNYDDALFAESQQR